VGVPLPEAKQVYRMLQLHRAQILTDESRWGVNPDGTPGTRNLIAEVNADPKWAAFAQVQTLTGTLNAARDSIIAWVNTQLPIGTPPVTVASIEYGTSIYLDAGRNLTSEAVDPDNATVLNARELVNGVEQSVKNILIGEGGDDILIGGKGDDILIGGNGKDSYRFSSGDGNDRIVDQDGLGRIVFTDAQGRSSTASLAAYSVDGQATTWTAFMPDGGTISYSRNSPLTITFPDGTATVVEDFDEGELGIRLKTLPQDETPSRTIVGDKKPDDFTETLAADANGNLIGIQPDWRNLQILSEVRDGEGNLISADVKYNKVDDLGNFIASTPEPDRADTLFGSAGADLIQSGGGADTVTAGEGGDQVQAGSGRDLVHGQGGNDLLEGGAGGDILSGGAGDDRL